MQYYKMLKATKMSSASLLIALCLCSPAAAQYWQSQRDDLAEYALDTSVKSLRSDTECAALAMSQHDAVRFNQTDGTCHMFICQLGVSGCRKCRNAKNSSLPVLHVRVLDPQLGRSCWRTFQRRVDGSVDFYRNWTDYVSGFGQGEDRNYWMGLEAIHQLTQAGDRRVRWEMSMWNGSWFWAESVSFAVQGAAQGYRVTKGNQDASRSNVIENTRSNRLMNNQMFSTHDKEQDSEPAYSCAIQFQSGWWHNACHGFNPNGRYYTPPTAYSIPFGNTNWATGLVFANLNSTYPLDYTYSMQTVECLVMDSAPNV